MMYYYQQQPNGLGYTQPSYYGGGTSKSRIPGATMLSQGFGIDKAPVGCNCCNFTHNGCSKFWVIFNSIQVTICFVALLIDIFVNPKIFNYDPNVSIDEQDLQKYGPSFRKDRRDSAICALKTIEPPVKNAKMYILITLLVIYTIASVLYSVAVLAKNMDVRTRSLFLIIYTASIACFPLAYIIPVLIDVVICFKLGLLKLLLFGLWYIIVLITTGLAFNVAIVFRRWIMRPNKAVMPQSQQQIIQKPQPSSSTDQEISGNDQDSDSDS